MMMGKMANDFGKPIGSADMETVGRRRTLGINFNLLLSISWARSNTKQVM